jgi:hypothetical protein
MFDYLLKFRSERIAVAFREASKYLNLDQFESFENENLRRAQYKANAKSWKSFSSSPESIPKLKKVLEETVQRIDTISLDSALSLFECAVKEHDGKNNGYTHYERCLLEGKLREARTEGYVHKKALVAVLQCPKRMAVGFGSTDPKNKSATGDFLEVVLYPFLQGIVSSLM